MNPRPLLTTLLAALMALALAACAAPAPATPAPADPAPTQPTPAQPAPVDPTPADPPTEPTPTDPPAQPPPGNGDATLRDMFPATVAGQALSPQVLTLQQLIDEFGDTADDLGDVTFFLSQIGRGPGDVSVAFAATEIDGEFVNIAAFRAPGVAAQQMLAALAALEQRDLTEFDDVAVVRQDNVGGKSVTVIELEDAFEDEERVYLYAVGDVAFQIDAIPEIAALVLADLP